MPRKNRGAKLTVPQVAERLGISPPTWRGYVSKAKKEREAGKVLPSHAPEADGKYDDRTPWWWEATIAEYEESRRGQGWRAGEGK
ncbi:hypothetical protein AB0B94_30905 [Micromonospora sp. NPDC048986]|uniref:hypothetical protein n=1 Tax=Micromonospora sp. NPDC048986 TaxID=3155644 RepID=UPI0033F0870A